jgi:hypothetical protein
MYHITLCTHALNLILVSHTCIFAIDPAVQGLEEPTEQAQIEDFTNVALDQGKPRCI